MSKRTLKELPRMRGQLGRAVVLALAFGVAGCGGGGLFGRSDSPASTGSTGSSSSPSFSERVSNLFRSNPGSQSSTQLPGTPGLTSQDIDCPSVDIRPGTSTFAVSTAGVEPSALTMRYQASFGQTARECKLAGNMLTIRVGVEGRIVVGPAGGPGQIDIPIRYAVVEEGPDPKTVTTKLRWQSVTIAPGEANVSFTQIEEELTFQMPRGNNLDAYVVYIGYDRGAVREPVKQKPAKKPAPVARRSN